MWGTQDSNLLSLSTSFTDWPNSPTLAVPQIEQSDMLRFKVKI